MDPGTDLEPFFGGRRDDRLRAADRASGAVERRQEAVTCAIDLLPAVLHDVTTHEGVVPRQQVAPALVPDLGSALSGVDHVREEHSEQDAVRLRTGAAPVTNLPTSPTMLSESPIQGR